MSLSACPDRLLRLLVIAPWNSILAMDAILFGTLTGFERVSISTDCDDGLRLALMMDPDVILLTWSASALKLLNALIHLRGEQSTPLIAVVADSASPPDGLFPNDDILVISADQLNDHGLARLRNAAIAGEEKTNVSQDAEH